MSPEQYSAAELQHEKQVIAAKQEKADSRDEEALRVSMEQLREVIKIHGWLLLYLFYSENYPIWFFLLMNKLRNFLRICA